MSETQSENQSQDMNATKEMGAGASVGELPATMNSKSDGPAASQTKASADTRIIFENVSKFYGEVLGVNRVNLQIEPGITSLVGPNGSGKSTLMNLMAGLLKPTVGKVNVLGHTPDDPERMFREVGYCTQFDAFPRGMTGLGFIMNYLRESGYPKTDAEALAWRAIDRVDLRDAAKRKVGAYSKGMRQRIKLAQAIAHEPSVLVLDEPLNGLDPMARAEVIALFKEWAQQGLHLIISSHILHEVDMLSDRVVLMNQGYVVAEGDIRGVRQEMDRHPAQVLIRCAEATMLAGALMASGHVSEIKLHEDGAGLQVHTHDADSFYELLNRIVVEQEVHLETVTPVDDDVLAVYQYLIVGEDEL